MERQFAALAATRLRAPAQPARLLSLTQQRSDMPLATKTAGCQLADSDLLRRTFGRLP